MPIDNPDALVVSAAGRSVMHDSTMASFPILTEVPSLQLIEATAVSGEYRLVLSDGLGHKYSLTVAVDEHAEVPLWHATDGSELLEQWPGDAESVRRLGDAALSFHRARP
jgi:hypothetical protein